MEPTEIRARIRTMLKTGEMPCEDPESTWAGNGDGQRCAGCLAPVRVTDVEYEVDLPSGVKLRLHRACYAIWLEECEPASSN